MTWSIALVIWLADVVARSVRELLWESLSLCPSIVTPSNFIRRKDDIETAVEMLLKLGLQASVPSI